jgi:RimJ/RimL family protein N-acetyltransferase
VAGAGGRLGVAAQVLGRGYATEAARASVEYAFNELKQTRVISLIAPANAASIRVAERLGERPAGEWEVFGTRVIIHAIEREEWERGRT